MRGLAASWLDVVVIALFSVLVAWASTSADRRAHRQLADVEPDAAHVEQVYGVTALAASVDGEERAITSLAEQLAGARIDVLRAHADVTAREAADPALAHPPTAPSDAEQRAREAHADARLAESVAQTFAAALAAERDAHARARAALFVELTRVRWLATLELRAQQGAYRAALWRRHVWLLAPCCLGSIVVAGAVAAALALRGRRGVAFAVVAVSLLVVSGVVVGYQLLALLGATVGGLSAVALGAMLIRRLA